MPAVVEEDALAGLIEDQLVPAGADVQALVLRPGRLRGLVHPIRVRLLRRILFEGSVRGDLLSGFRSTQYYLMGSYFFGEPRRGGSGR